MKFVTLDFETYYDSEYSLTKMTTEAYVRDPRFECIMMGYKIDDDPHQHCVVGHSAVQLIIDNLALYDCAVLAHHAHFDGLILSHHFDTKPKVWFDTLSMARALHGTDVGNSLAKLLVHYNVGITKGTDVADHKGRHLAEFTGDELASYKMYCKNDVEGTKRLFNVMVRQFPKSELKLIDMVVRMFTEPKLELDVDMLEEYKTEIQANKLTHLLRAGVQLDEVMSNVKFAEALERLGVTPPMKTSLKTGQPAFAFAKTDHALMELAEHPDEAVQALVAARLQNKTTINETRAQRMIEMARRGPACLYYKYAGANQTMRLSGGDGMNWQNLPRKGPLRDAIYTPEGYVLVVVDSANIEARVLDWLACQNDMLNVYRAADAGTGPDVYCVMAGRLFGYVVDEAMKMERQAGKTVKLACGYQMGPDRYRETARIMGGLRLDDKQAAWAVNTYRATHPMVVQLWNRGMSALTSIATGPESDKYLDSRGVLRIEKGAIVLPNGLPIRYPQMNYDRAANSWSFADGKGKRKYIYGGKVVENVVQGLAKIVVMDQLVEVNDRYKKELLYQPSVTSTHDEGGFYVPEDMADDVLAFARQCMSQPPRWAPDLPVYAKGAIGIRYGDAH